MLVSTETFVVKSVNGYQQTIPFAGSSKHRSWLNNFVLRDPDSHSIGAQTPETRRPDAKGYGKLDRLHCAGSLGGDEAATIFDVECKMNGVGLNQSITANLPVWDGGGEIWEEWVVKAERG